MMTRTMTQNAHESCECTASFYVLAKRTLENTLIIAARAIVRTRGVIGILTRLF